MGSILLITFSIYNFVELILQHLLHLEKSHLHKTFFIQNKGDYEIFREGIKDTNVKKPVVLVVGFRLKFIKSNEFFHWLFQRLCILTTPFWSGFNGFHIKLWMVDKQTKNYLGIYEWDGKENAQVYMEMLEKTLNFVSVKNSVWHEMHEAKLGSFLSSL